MAFKITAREKQMILKQRAWDNRVDLATSIPIINWLDKLGKTTARLGFPEYRIVTDKYHGEGVGDIEVTSAKEAEKIAKKIIDKTFKVNSRISLRPEGRGYYATAITIVDEAVTVTIECIDYYSEDSKLLAIYLREDINLLGDKFKGYGY